MGGTMIGTKVAPATVDPYNFGMLLPTMIVARTFIRC